MNYEQQLNRNNSLCHKIMSRVATKQLVLKHHSKQLTNTLKWETEHNIHIPTINEEIKRLKNKYLHKTTCKLFKQWFKEIHGVLIPCSQHEVQMHIRL